LTGGRNRQVVVIDRGRYRREVVIDGRSL